jgi:hypothetical protein
MKPIDFAKAAGFAILLLVLNVLIATLVILFYSLVIEPGHPHEFYNEAALRIAPWCSHIFGTALFFVAGYWLSKRRPDRHSCLFATAFTLIYVLIDAATVGFVGIINLEFAISNLAKLLASLAGAFLATRQGSSRSGQVDLGPQNA